MEKEKRYNGWTNYETWVAKLWIDNDEEMYRKALSTNNVEELKNVVEEIFYQGGGNNGSLMEDLAKDSLNRIDYKEIYENIKTI